MTGSIWKPDPNTATLANANNSYLSQRFVIGAADSKTVFTLTAFAYAVNTNSLLVYVNGVDQFITIDYLETDPTHVTFTSPLRVSDIVVIRGLIGSANTASAAASAGQASAYAVNASASADNAAASAIAANTSAGNANTSAVNANTSAVAAAGSAANVVNMLATKADKANPVFSGNAGFGTALSGWYAGWTTIEKNKGAWMSHPAAPIEYFLSNCYYDGAAFRAVSANSVAQFIMSGFDRTFQWITAPSVAAGVAIAPVEAMRITANSNLLIGTATDNATDKLQVAGSIAATGALKKINTAGISQQFLSVAGSTTASTYGNISNSGGSFAIGVESSTGVSTFVGTSAYASCLGTTNATPLQFATNNTIQVTIDSNGNLLAGVNTGTYHTINKVNGVQGTRTLGVGNNSVVVDQASTIAYNAAATVLSVGRVTGTGRSINTEGTFNGNGADYAEYMLKSDTCGIIAKGQVVGINSEGKLTDKWNEAISFAVKTTNPSFVGGDSWGAGLEGDELEVARAKVDRIAFCGQVPVNLIGATPGQYVVPAQLGEGITAVLINAADMTLNWYMSAVGVVQNILPDGRANMRVKSV